MTKLTNRKIENFELNAEYYEQSFLNGNKNHVAEELTELMLCSLTIFHRILMKLPAEIQNFVLNSNFYTKAIINIK